MPATSRTSAIPRPAVLGLQDSRAGEDIAELGWDNTDHVPALWALAGSGRPNLALNTMLRLAQGLKDAGEAEDFDRALREDARFRVRLMALIGGSSAFGDHLAAHPETWRELLEDLPTREEMMAGMLESVGATPAFEPGDAAPGGEEPDDDSAGGDSGEAWRGDPDPASEDLSTAGTYRAAESGRAAETKARERYRTLMMRIAAHDLAGTFPETQRHPGHPEVPIRKVMRLLSDLADAAVTCALAVAVRTVYGDERPESRLAVVALGKCGAQELNFLSDVDVLFVAEPATSKATRLAAETTAVGSRCFFEIDANLRPEGRSGALVRTLASHVAYYDKWAETWEFQAQLKGRAQAGNLALGEAYTDAIGERVWEASRRDSFVADIQAMRRRVVDNVPKDEAGRELKLGKGGLRDVEFAVQLLQLVHGRSDVSLRVRSTLEALDALIAGGYVGREDGPRLQEAYGFLRLLEHRLQQQRLKRTHVLPSEDDEENLQWVARSAGFRARRSNSATDEFVVSLRRVRLLISELHSRLFYRPLLDSVVNFDVDTLKLSPKAVQRQLTALGYQFPERAVEHLTRLATGSSRKARIQALLLPTLMEWLSRTADPDAGLLNYRKLSEAAHDKSWFLRLLRDEGVVGRRLIHILGTSPYTASLIIQNPDLVKMLEDGASGPRLMSTSPSTVSRSLVAAAGRYRDPDKAISVARSLRRSELARIASATLLGMLDVPRVCEALSRVWVAVLEASLRAEIRYRLAESGDEEPPARIAVIGMGRLGGAELCFGSDADVLFVAEPADGEDESRALKWASGVCDSMRRRLKKPSDDPPIEVDVGLRPEGRSGALVRTVESYRRYYERWGETWELQALLRAAPVAGDRELADRFLKVIDDFRYPSSGIEEATIREVRRMKARVDNERLPRGADRSTHTKLGRGGLTDIEWTVQLFTLMHAHRVPGLRTPSTLAALDVLAEEEILSARDAEILKEAWLTATATRNALVLVKGRRHDQLPKPGPQLAQVAGAAGWDPDDPQGFLEHYLRVTRRARAVVDQAFWGERTLEP